MTIQRHYSLPNCKLMLEGLSHSAAQQVGRPSLDVLIRFECHLMGQQNPLIGGRDLLDHLVAAVSDCTQQWLSGVRRSPRSSLNGKGSVQLLPLEPNVFHLIVSPALLFEGTLADKSSAAASTDQPVEMTLSTVEMFDLMEAFDQLLTDSQTLSNLSLELKPLSRRQAIAARPLGQRVAPLALGSSGLAVAAIALFFVPVPKVQRPQTQESTPSNSEQPSPQPSSGSPRPEAQQGAAGVSLASAPLITAPQQRQQLNQQLYQQVDQAWQTTSTFSQDLIYRVGVNPAGEILGYESANQGAADFVQEVPLQNLLKEATAGEDGRNPSPQPLAQYRLVFKPNGLLEVSSW